MENKINRFLKIYPWYSGLTGDLLFYIAIDTLFLTVVKMFSAAQIVSLTTISTIACIVLQFPLLRVIKKLGNTASVRIGALLLLLSAIFITFGTNYYLVVIGRMLHDIAVIFRSVSYVVLENNLELINRRQDYIRARTSANTSYAVVTMLIAFVASPMFNYNNYLPMFGCITTCAIGLILSFFMVDYSGNNRIVSDKNTVKRKICFSKLIVLAIVVYGLFFPTLISGQTEGKLFIQQHLLLDYDVANTALIIGVMLGVSRVVRVVSNIVFAYIYKKFQTKVGIILPSLLFAAIGLMIFGSFMPQIVIKIFVMSLGYVIIVFIRDPFRLYMQDVVLENTENEHHQTLLTTLEFAVNVVKAMTGLVFTLVLLEYPMLVVMVILFTMAMIEIFFSIRLYKVIMISKQSKTV